MHDVVSTPLSDERSPASPSDSVSLAERLMARQSLVGDAPFIDHRAISGLAELSRHWDEVDAELRPLLAGDSRWTIFPFTGYGLHSEANHARCPNTSALLGKIPGLVAAFFSVLKPGSHVPAHLGTSKAWLTCHLGMAVPQGPGRCAIQVGGETAEWREREWLVFDESRPHAMWNERLGPRVVLFVQVRRPMGLLGRLAAAARLRAVRRSALGQAVGHNLGAR